MKTIILLLALFSPLCAAELKECYVSFSWHFGKTFQIHSDGEIIASVEQIGKAYYLFNPKEKLLAKAKLINKKDFVFRDCDGHLLGSLHRKGSDFYWIGETGDEFIIHDTKSWSPHLYQILEDEEVVATLSTTAIRFRDEGRMRLKVLHPSIISEEVFMLLTVIFEDNDNW